MVRVGVVLAMAVAMVIPRMAAAQFTEVNLIDPPKERPGQHIENLEDGVYVALSSMAAMLAEDGSLRSYTSNAGITDTYQVSPCSLPTIDEAQREKNRLCLQAIDLKRNAWMKFLRQYADTDLSGFITREETAPICFRVRLGFHAAQLGISKPEDLLALNDYRHFTKARILAELAAYARLREAALKQNLGGLRELPAPLAQAVRVATAGAPAS